MKKKAGQRRPCFRGTNDYDPDLQYAVIGQNVNLLFLAGIPSLAEESGYSESSAKIYSVGVHIAFGFIQSLTGRSIRSRTSKKPGSTSKLGRSPLRRSQVITKDLLKLADYLRLRCHKLRPEKTLNWDYYLAGFPEWLAQGVRDYIASCRRTWPAERQFERSKSLLSSMTQPLRWMVAHQIVSGSLEEITPQSWVCLPG